MINIFSWSWRYKFQFVEQAQGRTSIRGNPRLCALGD